MGMDRTSREGSRTPRAQAKWESCRGRQARAKRPGSLELPSSGEAVGGGGHSVCSGHPGGGVGTEAVVCR